MNKEILKKNKKLSKRRMPFGLLVFLMLTLCSCARSANENAIKYRNGRCIVFYPPENETIREYAMSLCESREDKVLDYIMEEAGDYFRITYDSEEYFYVNEDMSDLDLNVINGREMLSDMLRYEMKKDEIDAAYTAEFWSKSDKDSIDLENIDLKLEKDHLDLYFKDFEYTLEKDLYKPEEANGRHNL